mmetsp:Transcript_1942/g.4779  ORF Transcript_1942/g.4779 Transcript_1942/m.4779 type:complete len:324 (-) Transcript_1942:769-1740(-)
MTKTKYSHHVATDDSSGSESGCAREEERTIPFLRRLVDMLQENTGVISFCRGSSVNGELQHGQIVVHDRIKMESDILPRYFNHSSFASLRRQLNYFSFTRVGKGRQRGATYSNAAVVELDDILRLKRRTSVGHGSSSAVAAAATTVTAMVSGGSNTNNNLKRSVSVVSPSTSTSSRVSVSLVSTPAQTSANPKASTAKAVGQRADEGTKRGRRKVSMDTSEGFIIPPSAKKARFHKAMVKPTATAATPSAKTTLATIPPSIVSPPVPFSPTRTTTKTIALDLTVPSPQRCASHFGSKFAYRSDDDILAGCNALLSFSRGLSAM